MALRLLVLDCYTLENRNIFKKFGMALAGNLYRDALINCAPIKPTIHILNIVEDSLPNNLQKYDGVVWSGSSLSVYDKDPVVKKQIDFANQCFDQKVPSFGSCWALQIASVACGGKVRPNVLGRESRNPWFFSSYASG